MKTIKLSILLLFACTLAIAQSSLNSITLTNAITDTNTEQLTLSSMAAVKVGDLLFVDREAMKVVRVGLVTVSVIRGSNSRAAIHAAGATVLSGSPDKFFSYDPPAGGPCTATALPVTPLVNISNGNQWTCTNGVYLQSAGAGGATRWGGVLGTLSDQTDLQTALDGKVGTARTVNGHALTGNVAVTYGDLGVIPAADLPNPGASSLGGVQSKDCSSVGIVQKINTDGTVTCAALSAINPQTATYQVLAADFSGYKTITAASGTFTVTLVASGSQPAAGQYITLINYGSGVVTIAPSGQNINGSGGSLTLAAGSATVPTSVTVYSDGTNYFARTSGASAGSTWNAPVSLASIPACSASAFFQPFTDAAYTYAYCNGSSTLSYYISGQQVTPIVTANWTTLGSGGTRTDQTKAINIVGTTGGTGNVYGISATVAGGDFSHVFVVLPALAASTSNSNIQVGFTDGTKVEGCGPYWIASSGAGAWSAVVTDGKSTALSAGTYTTANGDTAFLETMNQGVPLFFKLTRTGTALACAYSYDGGMNYVTLFNDTVPFLTASSVAVWADPRGAAGAPRFSLVAYQ